MVEAEGKGEGFRGGEMIDIDIKNMTLEELKAKKEKMLVMQRRTGMSSSTDLWILKVTRAISEEIEKRKND